MIINSRISVSVLFGLIFLAGSALAATSTIEGIVRDPKGQAIKNADVRIEAQGGSTWSKVTKTDMKGRFVHSDLAVGNYRVSLLVDGAVKASINNVKTKPSEPTQLNFDLKKSGQGSTSAKKAKHFVWVPAQTGSNIGGGWVEVDENGNASNGSAVKKVGGSAVARIQSDGSFNRSEAGVASGAGIGR